MRLQVTVQLRDEIVDDVVVPVSDGMRLGESDDAVVAFPGLDLLIQRDEDTVLVRGHRLREGQKVDFGVDDVLVSVTPVAEARLPRTPLWRGDIALPVLLLAAILVTLTGHTVHQVIQAKADVSAGVARTVEAFLLPPSLRAPEPDPAPAPGPVARDPWEVPNARYVEQAP